MNDIHTCSYHCERPACILAQRDELAERFAEAATGQADVERLVDCLRCVRGAYVEPALRHERETFRGYERGSNIAGIEADLRQIDAVLAPFGQQQEGQA